MILEIKKAFEKRWIERYGNLNAHDYAYYHAVKMLEESVHDGLVAEAAATRPAGDNPILTLMHDTAHDLDTLKNMTDKMLAVLKEKKESNSNLFVIREYIDGARKSIRDQLDLFYVKSRSEYREGNK